MRQNILCSLSSGVNSGDDLLFLFFAMLVGWYRASEKEKKLCTGSDAVQKQILSSVGGGRKEDRKIFANNIVVFWC